MTAGQDRDAGCAAQRDRIRSPALTAVLGDVTTMHVDAVVNAANRALAGGGGVDGAIHRAAGPELLAACRTLGGCKPGDAKATLGFALPARYIVHTVGPVWNGGDHGERAVLASCYRRSFEVAESLGAVSIAFPAIATGVYGFPSELAAGIAVRTLRSLRSAVVREVVLVAFDPSTLSHYRRHLHTV